MPPSTGGAIAPSLDSASLVAGAGSSRFVTSASSPVVTAIDAEAGTITVDHGPVPAIEWPAMTMAFEADEQLRSEVSVGEGIAFEFRTGSEGSVITSITKE